MSPAGSPASCFAKAVLVVMVLLQIPVSSASLFPSLPGHPANLIPYGKWLLEHRWEGRLQGWCMVTPVCKAKGIKSN